MSIDIEIIYVSKHPSNPASRHEIKPYRFSLANYFSSSISRRTLTSRHDYNFRHKRWPCKVEQQPLLNNFLNDSRERNQHNFSRVFFKVARFLRILQKSCNRWYPIKMLFRDHSFLCADCVHLTNDFWLLIVCSQQCSVVSRIE